MKVKQGRSSEILNQLYGEIDTYQKILDPYQNKLIQSYPNLNLEKFFSTINKKMIAIAPMAFCEGLMSDLGCKPHEKDLAALGLHMLAISTHDDVVDEMTKNRVELAALVYSGNIASNEGSKLLLEQGKVRASKILLDVINANHFYQQHVAETLWIYKPNTFEEFIDGVHHITIFVSIGLLYALALSKRMDLKQEILNYSFGYGIALQLIDDLRETKEDKKNGYGSFALVEGAPYKESFKKAHVHLQQAKTAIPTKWRNLHNFLKMLGEFVKSIEM